MEDIGWKTRFGGAQLVDGAMRSMDEQIRFVVLADVVPGEFGHRPSRLTRLRWRLAEYRERIGYAVQALRGEWPD